MRKLYLLALALTLNGTALCQNYTLPSVLFDSLAFETFRGRQCDSVRVAQADEILKKGKELIDTNKALELSQSSNSTLSALLNNSREANVVQAMQFQKDLQTEKRKVKRWRRIGIIQAAVIIGFIVLL